MNAIVLVIVAAPLRGAAWPDMPSVLVHGGGLDGLDALVDGGGFLGAAEATKRLGLALQDGHNLKAALDRKSTRLNSSHLVISYAVFCLKKKKINYTRDSGVLAVVSGS